MQLLNLDTIKQALLQTNPSVMPTLILHQCVTSTNDELMQLIPMQSNTPIAYIAEGQTKGRGRNGKHWQSAYQKNICFSLSWQFMSQAHLFTSLSLVTAIATINAIGKNYPQLNSRLQIKWPNDLWLDGSKLGGILIETKANYAIIGIGINCHKPNITEQAVTSLDSMVKEPINRNQLIGQIIGELIGAISTLVQHGFAPFLHTWHTIDGLYQQAVQLALTDRTVRGHALGINQQGALLIDDGQMIQAYQIGQVSLRLIKS